MTPSRNKPGVAFWATVVVVVLLVPITGYATAYLCMVSPADPVPPSCLPTTIPPDYRGPHRDLDDNQMIGARDAIERA